MNLFRPIQGTSASSSAENALHQDALSPSLQPSKDQFSPAEKNVWMNMSKSTDQVPSDIGSMLGAMSGQENNATTSDDEGQGMQALLSTFLVGPPTLGTQSSGIPPTVALPAIPKMRDLALSNPLLLNNMLPIVERYQALEKTYALLEEQTAEGLKSNVSFDEARSMQDQLAAIKKGRLEAKTELDQANYYYALQKLQEKAAADAQAALENGVNPSSGTS